MVDISNKSCELVSNEKVSQDSCVKRTVRTHAYVGNAETVLEYWVSCADMCYECIVVTT